MEVTREVYRVYYSGNRVERYQAERDQHHGLLRMSELEGQLTDADTNVDRGIMSSTKGQEIPSVHAENEQGLVAGCTHSLPGSR